MVEILTPAPVEPPEGFANLAPRVVRGAGTGALWEQLTLPAAAHDAVLVNLCNLGPLRHPRSVILIHDAQAHLFPADYSPVQRVLYRHAMPRMARRAARIVTVSDFARTSLEPAGIRPARRAAVVHNGADHILARGFA